MYHQQLERQIKKYLGESGSTDERLQQLLKAVSNSYSNYERDKELSEHAFTINEIEYQNVNNRLISLTEDLEFKVKERTKDLEDIAQFPIENPNPIFRVQFDGTIIFFNPAAQKIKNIVFEGVKYPVKKFFLNNIKYIKDSGSLDLEIEGAQYIFYYKKVEGKNYINFYGADVTEKYTLRLQAQDNFNRLKSFLESTEDAYYIIYSNRQDKNFINSKMNNYFGADLMEAEDIFKQKSEQVISEKPRTHYNKIKNLSVGEKLSIQYQIKNKKTNDIIWLDEVISKQYDIVLDDIVISGRITDITKEHQYSLKLQESEERFRSLIQAVPVMIWVTDENNKVIYSNQASRKLLGFEIEKSKSPREFISMIHPEDRKRVMQTWDRNISKKKPFTSEFRVKNAHEQYQNILENGVPRFYTDGKFAGYIGAFFNLTNEKSFQKELLIENQKLDLLTKNSPDIIFLTDKKGIIEYVSPTAQRILGYKMSELRNNDIKKFICKECNSHLEKNSWLLKFDGKSNNKFEYRMIKKNGDLLWVESLISFIQTGSEQKILMHNRDIHSIKEAENILKENEQKYRGLFENMELGIMEVDLNERIQWVNRSFEMMSGYSLKYLKGKNAMKLFLSDDHTKQMMQTVNETRKNRNDTIYEIKMKKSKGELIDVVISGSPIIDLQGNVKGSVGIHWNVTDIRKIERMLEEEKLSRQKEIMQATLNAEEQQREILGNELHDGVGHILTYTSLYLQMASQSDQFTPDQFVKAHEKVDLALNEVRRISRSLVPPALLDLGLKEAIIELFNQYAGLNGFTFNMDCKKQDIEKIDADAQRNIYRIVQELINNTIKHAEAKAVKLIIKRINGNLLLHYYNDGKPFNPEKVKKGIGLQSITNRAYFYNGIIDINSTKTKGTNFTITLPLKNLITNE
jgi:PAS domain S-box-containing protein